MNKYGTGIGLFTANNIVAQMGPCEKMFISSEEGKGSKFSFFIYQNLNDKNIKNELSLIDSDK